MNNSSSRTVSVSCLIHCIARTGMIVCQISCFKARVAPTSELFRRRQAASVPWAKGCNKSTKVWQLRIFSAHRNSNHVFQSNTDHRQELPYPGDSSIPHLTHSHLHTQLRTTKLQNIYAGLRRTWTRAIESEYQVLQHGLLEHDQCAYEVCAESDARPGGDVWRPMVPKHRGRESETDGGAACGVERTSWASIASRCGKSEWLLGPSEKIVLLALSQRPFFVITICCACISYHLLSRPLGQRA